MQASFHFRSIYAHIQITFDLNRGPVPELIYDLTPPARRNAGADSLAQDFSHRNFIFLHIHFCDLKIFR